MAVVFQSDGYWGAVLGNGMSKLMVLRALYEGPGHGYALARRIRETTHGFLSPRHGGLYTVLRQFERSGCVRHRVDMQGRRLSKIYELTMRGRRALDAGLAAWEKGDAVMRRAMDLR